MMDILKALDDPKVFGPSFRDPETWKAWRVYLAALFALPMTEDQLAIYRACTAREDPPSDPAKESWLVCGRRGGKSFVLALIACYLAVFEDWRPYLGPGEIGTIMVIAADRKQARSIMNFIKGILKGTKMLASTIKAERVESIDLANSIRIEVHNCSFRSTRGYTVCCALLDEVAIWRGEDSANPDQEVLASIRPAMVTIPGAMLLCASSPISRKGALWESYRRHFGKPDDPVLIWHAPSRTMNPLIPQSDVDEALERDPSRNRAEYLAEWRTDIEGFVTREALEACIDPGVRERPPMPGIKYNGYVDLAGGGPDSFALVIAHRDAEGRAVQDCIREVRGPSQNPSRVIEEFAAVLRSYEVKTVRGDRYAAEWPVEAFAKHGIKYIAADKFKSETYLQVLPLINSRAVVLLDHTKQTNQFLDLDRVVARGGHESIDHPRGGHDDICNAASGALLLAAVKKGFAFCNGYKIGKDGLMINYPNPAFRSCESDGPGIRFVNIDEFGRELTVEEAQAIRRGDRLKARRSL